MYRKKLLLTMCILCVSLCNLSGCGSTPAERVAAVKQVIDDATIRSQLIGDSIEDVNKTVVEMQLFLSDPNVPPESRPQLEVALAAAKSKLDTLIFYKEKIDTAILQAQATLATVDMNNLDTEKEAAIYGSLVTSAAPVLPGKISGWVYLAGLLIPVVGGLVGKIMLQVQKIKQQTSELDKSKVILTNAVMSVDTLLDPKLNDGVIPEDKVKAAKFILEHNQLGVTSDAVDAIHDPMQNTAPKKL